MALIKCMEEYTKEISDKKNLCPNCGCPLSKMITHGVVKIKIPYNVVDRWTGLFSSRKAIITTAAGKKLWEGQHGENANFTIDEPTNVIINLGGWANEIAGRVYPKRMYALAKDMGIHVLATYSLIEIDVIDAE